MPASLTRRTALALTLATRARAAAPLRAAINLGNTVLARREPDGSLAGISVDIAREYAARTGAPLTLVPYLAAGQVTAAAARDEWDIAFLAIDPLRATGMSFTEPYLQIEGAYLVADAAPFRTPAELDQPGIRIAVGAGSAYDLYLTREIRHATLVRAPTSQAAIALFTTGLDAAAGVSNALAAFAATTPGYRLTPRFMLIQQAMAMPRAHDAEIATLRAYVTDIKRTGFVANAIKTHVQDATVP